MKHLYKTKQFLFRLFLAGIFLILYAVTASAVPVSAQGGISDDQRKASASLIKLDAYQGLDEAELSSGVWLFCGRAELGALTGETYYDGALYVETLGERSDYFVLAGDSLAWTGYSQGRSLGMLPDNPFSLRPLKIAYNDTKIPVTNNIKTYSSKGLLNVRSRLSARGETSFQSIRQGKGLVMAGDTIDNIVLTRHTDDYIIRSEETGDTDTTSRIVYRWFEKDSAIPLAIQTDGILYLNTSLPESPQDELSDGQDNTDHIQSVIDEAIVERDGSTVIVRLSEELPLHIYIMDIPGNIYSSSEGCADRFTLDTSKLQHNTYFISIVSKDSAYTRRILLNL